MVENHSICLKVRLNTVHFLVNRAPELSEINIDLRRVDFGTYFQDIASFKAS